MGACDHPPGDRGQLAGQVRLVQRRDGARRAAAREAAGLLEKIEDYVVKMPLCDRCGTVLEPLLSEQWFARMSPELVGPAIRAVVEEKIRSGF